LVVTIALFCFLASNYLDYRITALLLLMTVSIIAMFFDIIPVVITAVVSGLLLNFFFIHPLYTFHIKTSEDVLLFFVYLFIALVNAVLTFNIREAEQKARDKEEKEKTIQLYTTLLNSLSHELRTPIATIISAIDTLKEGNHKLSPVKQSVLLEEIDKASIRLNKQVENLLNMSRLETGMLQLNRDWCDINELIFTVIQKTNVLAAQHTIVFNPDEQLPFVKLDSGIMQQVLQNLIHNAILYTPENTSITLEAKIEQDTCLITVADNGNGFPTDQMELVFDKFYRIPNSKAGGSGLGLSIVKGFIEAHNGTILLKNLPNAGAAFTLAIPTSTSYINHLKNE
jgi:two-component system, OmpR family, sensor histidine kinase KdpD